ncbi:hypothetical protein SORBI_3007G100100 [Sorghum bicolor]|uniref:Uncharacterized protein n=1 Tax=Sorghum bicolor TaxID=4558 RepID=A0A1B6PGU8_SORBI|nr:hypothetical protein SORBI_3007G100100 [Sorghum bicolor]
MNLNLSHYLLHFQETYCPFLFTVALHFHDKSKTTHILQYVALELRCSCHWKTHQPEQRGEATKMEAGRRKKYVAALLPCGARY